MGVWEVSDEALLAGVATGDRDAAAVFVRRFQHRAFGLALVMTRDRAAADEIAQDAFVRAWRYADSYDARRGPAVGWLLTIVRNVALDWLRARGRRPEDAMPELPIDAIVDDSDTAELAAEHDDAAHILAAMRSLPAEQRQAILAVTMHGLTAQEYSDATHVPLGTVKTRIRLGLRKLRDDVGVRSR